jgi:hypothetical protein
MKQKKVQWSFTFQDGRFEPRTWSKRSGRAGAERTGGAFPARARARVACDLPPLPPRAPAYLSPSRRAARRGVTPVAAPAGRRRFGRVTRRRALAWTTSASVPGRTRNRRNGNVKPTCGSQLTPRRAGNSGHHHTSSSRSRRRVSTPSRRRRTKKRRRSTYWKTVPSSLYI